MNNLDMLDKASKVNRMFTVWSAINILSMVLVIMLISYLFPIMPNGYVYGKTPILQYLAANIAVKNYPKVFILIIIILLIVFFISLIIKKHIKKKYKNLLL